MPDCPACTTTYAEGLGTCPQCGAGAPVRRGRAVPLVVVECATDGCVAYGHPRSVQLNRAGSWLYELPRLLCAACGQETRTVQEVTMPKITVAGGPSNAADATEPEPDAPAEPTQPDAEPEGEPDAGPGDAADAGPSNADIRAWCADQDPPVEVSPSGPIPKAVREQYDAAHAPADA